MEILEMTEQQQEIILNNCEKCSCKIDEYDFESEENLCGSCANRINDGVRSIQNDFSLTQHVISKLIYNEVSKSDLVLFHKIIFFADQDAFSEFEINQTKLATILNMKQANISRSLKKLIKAKLLSKKENTNLYSFTVSHRKY
jgi:DNA-binding MarR family transcriptional regulator